MTSNTHILRKKKKRPKNTVQRLREPSHRTFHVMHVCPSRPDEGSESRQCHRTCPACACCFHHGNGTPVTARCIHASVRPAAHASECAYSHP
jgi:hypothetical protein